jgi:dienelactone hydrolase
MFGKTNTTPMLWIYSKNDSFFNADLSQKIADAFSSAGGHATFILSSPFERDGHHLFFGRGGSSIWGPLVERYLASVPAS